LNKATMNIPSEFRIASIAPNHALILPNDANPGRIDREFIDLWTRIPRFIGRLSTSASSHHDLSLAAFITNIVESDFGTHRTASSVRPNMIFGKDSGGGAGTGEIQLNCSLAVLE